MKKITKEIILFYILAFLFTWLFWVPQSLNDSGILFVPEFILNLSKFGAFGPLVAALGLTVLFEGKDGLRRILLRCINFKFRFKWYLFIFLTFPLIMTASLLLAGTQISNLLTETNPMVLIVGFFVVFFTAGPIQEELGWRGYALDRLQKKWSALTSSIIVGFLWGLWHFPLFFMNRDDVYYNKPMLGLFLSTILISILFTWIYNHTNKSIFAMLLFHTMWNYSHWIFPTLNSEKASLIMMILLVSLGFVVAFFFRLNRVPKEVKI